LSSPDRFKQSVTVTIAKRAAYRCSNPDCGAVTSGPAEDSTKAVNVGEAAHIFGANPGSARYDASMQSIDRADISNAIWLCGNCHKLIDDDPLKYPPGLLFEWQREHERDVARQVGKAGAILRQKYEKRHLEEFGRLSYLAERIILEKGDYWEYRLTAEVLRFETAPVLRRWRALERSTYSKANYGVSKVEFTDWFQVRVQEITQISAAFAELTNGEFQRAWGDPGVPGNEMAIVETCRYFAAMSTRAVEWEEAVRFVYVPDVFEETSRHFVGVAGRMIDEAAKVPEYLQTVFGGAIEPGSYQLSMTLTLPDGWNAAIEASLKRATDKIIAGM
jgi:hypothetical protein